MPTYTQDYRPIGVTTPLGKDALLLTGFSGQEEMSRLFTYHLEFESDKDTIDPTKIVGQKIDFWVDYEPGKPRHFNGIVARFAFQGKGDRLSLYRAEVVPAFWLLTRTSDCRIFQNKNVGEILQEVLKDLDVEYKLGSHPKRDYCVQYRESDFAFASRLMEDEGIFYFFKHAQGKHTLVISDKASDYYDLQDKKVNFKGNLASGNVTDDITAWEHQYEFHTGKWAYNDYNFETPSTNLTVNSKSITGLPGTDKLEVYDFPGEYVVKGDGDKLVGFRQQHEDATYDVVRGSSVCRSFSPGGKFTLEKHHSSGNECKSYVVTSVQHSARVGSTYQTGGTGIPDVYRNSFTCIPDKVVNRPERLTPRPMIHGSQTAVVVGPKGEEIYTDKYGRVKVQFHWDREGKKDEKSSRWIRCSQFSAGKGWGSMSIPRIGQEVVVTFVEGNPDWPLITGCVYNAEQMPAYNPEQKKTVTCFKSNSSPGGNGFNEIRFDDEGGKEQIYVHAQYDMDLFVEHDRRSYVKNNQHHTVDGNVSETVKGNQEYNTDGNVTENIGGNHDLSIGGNDAVIIAGNAGLDIGGNYQIHTGGTTTMQADGGLYISSAADMHLNADAQMALTAAAPMHIKAKMISMEADSMISLKVGGNFVVVSAMGVMINGMPCLINSGGSAMAAMAAMKKAIEKLVKKVLKVPDKADDRSVTGRDPGVSGQKSAA